MTALHAPDPITLAFDALLRPSALLATLRRGRRMLLWALLAVAFWLGWATGLIWIVGQFLLPLDLGRALAGLALAQIFALVLAAMAGQFTSASAPGAENAVFWFVRCQLAIASCLAPLVAILFGLRAPGGELASQLGLLLVVSWPMLLGGTFVVVLLRLRERNEAAAVRWLCAGAALVLALELRWSALAPPGLLELGALGVAAFGAGVLRPLSWVWEAPLSVGLALAARFGLPVAAARSNHPASFDELSLLPLPGLAAALARACADDLEAGGPWLLAVAGHSGQGRAARRALRLVLRRRRHGHRLLFWLSTTPEGAAWLREIAGQRAPEESLAAAYAALTAVEAPDWWPVVIERHRSAFAAASELPGGAAMLALLDASRLVLRAERWPAALAALRAMPDLSGAGDDPIWVALRVVHGWAHAPQPAFAADQERLIGALMAELADLQGWPIDLIAAMAEQLRYLVRVEQQRGALLV